MKVKFGIDNLKEVKREGKVGMYTNISGVTSRWERSVDIIRPDVIFTGEHGYYEEYQPGEKYYNYRDAFLSVPVVTVYRKADVEELSKISLLYVDIQDAGVRTFTYLSNLFRLIRESVKNSYKVVVLDRPNPLSGSNSFGSVSAESEVDVLAPFLPFVYPFTIGELALYYGDRLSTEVEVVKMSNYSRDMYYGDTGLPFSSPSPNLSTEQSIYLYPALVLLEGFKVSIGRGTQKPFRLIGAPYLGETELYTFVKSLRIDGLLVKPAVFIPTDNIFKGERCYGVEFFVNDVRKFPFMKLAFYLVDFFTRVSAPLVAFANRREGGNFIELLYNKKILSDVRSAGVEKFYEDEYKKGKAFLSDASKYFIY